MSIKHTFLSLRFGGAVKTCASRSVRPASRRAFSLRRCGCSSACPHGVLTHACTYSRGAAGERELPKLQQIGSAHDGLMADGTGARLTSDGTVGVSTIMGSPILGLRSVQICVVLGVAVGMWVLSPAARQGSFAHLKETRDKMEAVARVGVMSI
jgi:hypothetical protein